MALDDTSERNFETRSPEEAIRLIENLMYSHSTKNANLDKMKLAEADGTQIDEVKEKLENFHNLLVARRKFILLQNLRPLNSVTRLLKRM